MFEGDSLAKSSTKSIPQGTVIPLMPEDVRTRQAAWLLLASLGVFFFSSMILYVIYIALRLNNESFERVPLELPKSFVLSTLLLVGISFSLHFAGRSAQRDQSRRLLGFVIVAIGLAILFFVVQTDGMIWMLDQIRRIGKARSSAYAFTFLLALVHALHVVGGMVGLFWVLVNTLRSRYDHERNYGVQFCSLYWHFLDVVWLVMVSGFAIASWMIAT